MDIYGFDTQFDRFGCEHWDSACDNMPQEYVDEIVRQTIPKGDDFDNYDPKNIWDVVHMADVAKDFALYHPREGQPDFSETRFKPWAEEALLRKDEIRAMRAKQRQR